MQTTRALIQIFLPRIALRRRRDFRSVAAAPRTALRMNPPVRWSAACDVRDLQAGARSEEAALSGLVPSFPLTVARSVADRPASARLEDLGAAILSGERVRSSEVSR
jgi:hypothetical protein